MKTITKNGYEITVVDRREDYSFNRINEMLEPEHLAKRIFKVMKFQQSLKNKKPRD